MEQIEKKSLTKHEKRLKDFYGRFYIWFILLIDVDGKEIDYDSDE